MLAKMRTHFLVVVLFISAAISYAHCSESQGFDKRVALVIGNSKYIHAPQLSNPVFDAKAIANKLRSLHIEVTEGYDLSISETRALILQFLNNLEGAKSAIVYYAGHGVAVDGDNYVLPVDIDLKSPAELDINAISVSVILRQLKREDRINIVILDACRDNPFAGNLSRSNSRSVVLERGLQPINGDLARGYLIAFASDPGSAAADGEPDQHSPFTAAILMHIEDPDKPVESMMHEVRDEVWRNTNKKQLPWVNTSIIGDFKFNPSNPIVTIPRDASPSTMQTTENLLWESADKSGTIADYQTYLETFPNGVFSPLARRRITALATMSTAESDEKALGLTQLDIKSVQTLLSANHLEPGLVDGVLKEQTRTALREWQRSHSLPPTGFLDRPQLAMLREENRVRAVQFHPDVKPRAASVPTAISQTQKPKRHAVRLYETPQRAAILKPKAHIAPVGSQAQSSLLGFVHASGAGGSSGSSGSGSGGGSSGSSGSGSGGGSSGSSGSGSGGGSSGSSGSGSGGSGGSGGGSGWSDRRLKRDICLVGFSPSGLPVYSFRYIWSSARYIGVMAQDLLRLRPNSVKIIGGYYKVDYRDIDVRLEIQPARKRISCLNSET